MAVASVIPTTVTGLDEAVVVPSPSSPNELSPQHFTDPSAIRTQTDAQPPLIAVALVRPGTATGVAFPAPQHFTAPPATIAHVLVRVAASRGPGTTRFDRPDDALSLPFALSARTWNSY